MDNSLYTVFNTSARITAFLSVLANEKIRTLSISGVVGSAVGASLSVLQQSHEHTILVCEDLESAGYLYHDLMQFCGDEKVHFFPSGYKRAIKYGQVDPANEILRTEVLGLLEQKTPIIVVTYPEALAEQVVPPNELNLSSLRLAVGEQIDSSFVSDLLFEQGFVRVDYVYEPGQFAVRGSILDVFSFSHEYPYRIDFFGKEVESIRSFDIDTQLSRNQLKEISIVPYIITGHENLISLAAFVNPKVLWGFSDKEWILQRIETICNEPLSTQLVLAEEGDINATGNLVSPVQFKEQIKGFKQLFFGVKSPVKSAAVITYHTAMQPLFHKNFDLVATTLLQFQAEGYALYILSDNEKQINRLSDIFDERGDVIHFTPLLHALHEGFIDHDNKVCYFTDHQIFDRFHKYNLKSDVARQGKLALSLKELSQFEVGDYIVHIDHGVGRFGGLVRTPLNGKMQEMVKLIYSNEDILFVSIHALHKLAKYRGKEGEAPRINKLGSGAWERVKEKTKSKMKEIARDLIKLYAQRIEEKGFSFSPDTYMQQELEASFLYEDTPDQLKATGDVKRDMEREMPMDRLICGDVGFGKTEIAMRAAFKAVTDGKQVALLVPTTVLAYQHYRSFCNRFSDFPVKVEYLSRARKASDVRNLLTQLSEGKVDILIGTHRIIGKDVKFKDLGLFIVDEEQKFGVSVKEKLKQMKINVDTLTMTATPIPRTLQFSLMGARDLSVIATPPPNRYPIQTEVHTFDEDIIKEAINFEMSRNGQLFFVNNRINQLDELQSMVHRLVPDARVVVGHGQMDPHTLEQIIFDFSNYDYDVLIATTIIESGIDIPNTNTIIINNAQNYGLSDLHQLRGRVGRSNKKAFCYLMTPPLYTLNVDARRRLQAIENFSDLGSGIHIAMQDLDIRGAGNLLGAEQSGFIADLGYETYQKILKEAMEELREQEFAELYTDKIEQQRLVKECIFESDMELLIPSEYVPNVGERISLYQELDNIERETDLLGFSTRLKDRFGRIPDTTQELIKVVKLRMLSSEMGIEKVVLKQDKMVLFFAAAADASYFNGDHFGRILTYFQANTRTTHLRDVKGKRSFVVERVATVERALDIVQQIIHLSVVA